MDSTVKKKVLGVIPARLDSTRLPRKVLKEINGLPMVANVYFQAEKANNLDSCVVATDSTEVFEVMENLNIPAVMTSSDAQSGTDRMVEVAENSDADIFVNIQGDEPLIEPSVIDETVKPFLMNTELKIGTCASENLSEKDFSDKNVVKVTVNENGFAESFIRVPPLNGTMQKMMKHIGLYVFTREALLKFTGLERSINEIENSLEQLRALDNNIPVYVVKVDYDGFAIDTPEDLEKARSIFKIAETN
tara:strand:- start:10114 stop:10857 length:744 start_codon:yes stop_codon:yes gene_type:complete